VARRQGRDLPDGIFLVAEIRSTIVAAAPVDKGDLAFGSPDPCSEQLQELLRRSYTGATPLPESGTRARLVLIDHMTSARTPGKKPKP